MTKEECIAAALARETLIHAVKGPITFSGDQEGFGTLFFGRGLSGYVWVDFRSPQQWSRLQQASSPVVEHDATITPTPVDPYVEHRYSIRDVEAMTLGCATADGITGCQYTCPSCGCDPGPLDVFEPAVGYAVRRTQCCVCGSEL